MGAVLARTVTAGGIVYAAGTEETPELRAQVRNPRAWTGDTELEVPEPVVPTGDVVELVAAAVEAAVGRAKSDLLDELREEISDELDRRIAAIPLAEVTTVVAEPGDSPEEPPRGGKGSGEDVWRAHASAIGVDVSGARDRDDIVALVDQHKAAAQ